MEPLYHPLRARRITVKSIEGRSSTLLDFEFTGELDGFPFQHFAPTAHVRLVFPDGNGQLRMPTVVNDRLVLPEGERPIIRDYTPRFFSAGQLVIEMLRGHDGPASRWAENARPGDTIGLLGPRKSTVMPEVSSYVLVADPSAIPSLCRWLEEAPQDSSITAIVHAAPSERPELPTRNNSVVHWAETSSQVCGLLASTDVADDTFAWAAGEAGLMRTVRDQFNEIGIPRESRKITGYWRRGEAGFDHHVKIEES